MNDLVLCESCKIAGKTSRANEHGGLTTLMGFWPFYDEQGKCHVHDSNRRTNDFACSNGHKWTQISHGTCWCGWTGGPVEIRRACEMCPSEAMPGSRYCEDHQVPDVTR